MSEEQVTPAGPPLAEFYAEIQTDLTRAHVVVALDVEGGHARLWRAGVHPRVAVALVRELCDKVDEDTARAERDHAALQHFSDLPPESDDEA